MSLNALRDVPIVLLRPVENFGEKNLVNDRGVIVGGLRGLTLPCGGTNGKVGELEGSVSLADLKEAC